MAWTVLEHPAFAEEREALEPDVQDKLAEVMIALEEVGPQLGRPYVDTLKGSKHKNLKEIRFTAGGVWRFAFAFDNDRQAVVLVGGDKQGVAKNRFYRNLIRVAETRFDAWLEAEE